MSLTDLHKGTHNCAAAIRESGAGISPSPASSPAPLVVHPVVHPQAPVRSLSLSLILLLSRSRPLSLSLACAGEGIEPGHSVSALLSFFHTSGRRCRWFLRWYYGTPVVFSTPFLLLPLSHLPPSFSLSLSISLSPFLFSSLSSSRPSFALSPSTSFGYVRRCRTPRKIHVEYFSLTRR